ncbi:ABC transporter ATP-binding protein [Aerococcus urinae]|uniref:ABC transporter ATP-binding protein n=1 Tax=Aerococcus urinae TaxID=1376 RepID=UPI0018E18231|nr:ABC transporter ATP-binding protein [Aerococcus urinae]
MERIPVVELKNVTKKIKNKNLVENLTFQINKGEVFGFLGENGAGKTTTIRMIVGLTKISKGDIFINGYSISKDFKKAIKEVGAIVENPDLYKYMTGYQNLKHYARMYPNIDEKRIYESAKIVGIEKRLNDKVRTYSLGMRQRLGLAQALMHKPSLIILDEPTNGLDPEGIHELRNELKHLAHDEGVAVLVSSHLLSEMQLMCDRVGVIHKGKMVTVNKTEEFIKNKNAEIFIKVRESEVKNATEILIEFGKEISSIKENGIIIKMNEEEIPVVNKILSDQGIMIYGIDTKQNTLEDSFLKMLGEEK